MKPTPKLRRCLLLAASSLLAICSASAQSSGTWVPDADGNWTVAENWFDNIIADGSGNTANFTAELTADRIVSLNGINRTIGNIVFTDGVNSSNNLAITGNILTLAGTNPGVNVTQSARTLTINSVIDGTQGLTKTGAGTLTLGSTNKTYTGTTTISEGTLLMTSNRIQNSTTISIAGGATLNASMGLVSGQSVVGTGTGTATVITSSLIALGNNTFSHTGDATNINNKLFIQRLEIQGTGVEMTSGNIESGVAGSRRGLLVGNNAVGTFTISGGTFTSLGGNTQADTIGTNHGSASNILNISGGNYVNAGTLTFGTGATSGRGGTLNINSGSATIGTLAYASSTATGNQGIVNLNGGTLTLGAITNTSGTTREFNFNGGQFTASGAVNFSTGLTLNVQDGGAKINTNGNTVTVGAALLDDGIGGLEKSGAGTLNLNVANSYTGATLIEEGTLVLAGATQATDSITFASGGDGVLGLNVASPVSASNAAVNLANGKIRVLGSPDAASYTLLTADSIEGDPELAETIDDYSLLVVGNELRLVSDNPPTDPYLVWAGEGVLFGDDANGDGVPNGLAFLLGAEDPLDNALGRLPEPSKNNDGLVLEFQALPTAARGTATLTLEYSTSLAPGSWTSVSVPGAVGNTTNGNVTFSITDSDPLDDTNPLDVTATISAVAAPDGKLFARLQGME